METPDGFYHWRFNKCPAGLFFIQRGIQILLGIPVKNVMGNIKKDKDISGCQDCGYFEDDPDQLEKIFKNLRIMCSGYASVRGDSGICKYSDRFRMPRTRCEHFKPREA